MEYDKKIKELKQAIKDRDHNYRVADQWAEIAAAEKVALGFALKALGAAKDALRSYQFHNSSPVLAEQTADHLERIIKSLSDKMKLDS